MRLYFRDLLMDPNLAATEYTYVFPDQLYKVYTEAVNSFNGVRGWLRDYRHETRLHVIASSVGGMLQGAALDGQKLDTVKLPVEYYDTVRWLINKAEHE